MIRKGIGYATVTLHINQHHEEGVELIDIEQVGTGGLQGTTEKRHIDDVWGEHKDFIFGHVKGHCRRTKLSSLNESDEDEAWLKNGWAKDIVESDEVIDDNTESIGNGWVARQTWGFEDLNGERRYTRHVVVKKGSNVKRIKLVYDYMGPLKPSE